MSVVVSMQDVGPWRKQLTVEVPAPAVEAEMQRVIGEYGRRAKVPGFRKGKVPADLVRRRFAKDIHSEVIDRLLPRYWRQAQAEAELDPLLPPEVDEVRDLTPGAPFTFVATVETRPRIDLGDVHNFEMPDPQIEPGELDVDKALDDLRMRFGEWVPVERPAARGDLVHTQITELPDPALAAAPSAAAPAAGGDAGDSVGAGAGDAVGAGAGDGALVAGAADAENAALATPADTIGQPQPVEFEVGDARVWEELSLAVSGLTAGQETSFDREPPAPPPAAPGAEAEPAGRRRRFNVKVDAVKERELPALDDELAARVNPELGGLTALRELVVRRLREGRSEERDGLRRRAVLDQLRERHPLQLPQGVVEREVEHLAADYADDLARHGVRPEQMQVDWQRVREEARPHAERRVHERLLLDAVADADKVAVTGEEFEQALASLARTQKTTTPALRKALDEDGRLETLRQQMRRDKTLRHLMGELPAGDSTLGEADPTTDAAQSAVPGAGSADAADRAGAAPNPEHAG